MASETVTRVALFPLSVVLFPQGVLPLRVFEARYMDMVRDCMRDETSFGVCSGVRWQRGEHQRCTATAEVGCLERITAWDMQQRACCRFAHVAATASAYSLVNPKPNVDHGRN